MIFFGKVKRYKTSISFWLKSHSTCTLTSTPDALELWQTRSDFTCPIYCVYISIKDTNQTLHWGDIREQIHWPLSWHIYELTSLDREVFIQEVEPQLSDRSIPMKLATEVICRFWRSHSILETDSAMNEVSQQSVQSFYSHFPLIRTKSDATFQML